MKIKMVLEEVFKETRPSRPWIVIIIAFTGFSLYYLIHFYTSDFLPFQNLLGPILMWILGIRLLIKKGPTIAVIDKLLILALSVLFAGELGWL